MCAAAFTMCFAINPVPVASSSTVLCRTIGRISSYISSYAAPSFRMKRSYRPAFLSQKSLCSCIAITPQSLDASNLYAHIFQLDVANYRVLEKPHFCGTPPKAILA